MGEKEDELSSENSDYNNYLDKEDKEANQINNKNDIHNQLTECIDNYVEKNSNQNDRIGNINLSKNIIKNSKPSKEAAYGKSASPNSNKFKYKYYSSNNSKISTYYTNKKRKRSQYKKKQIDIKIGRKINEGKKRGEKNKYTSDDYDFWKNKVFEDCFSKLYYSMNYLSLKKYKIGLDKPTFSPLFEGNNDICLIKLSEYTVKEIFLSSAQGNIGENYTENIRINIDNILKEEENSNEKIKILKILFNKKFKEILLEMYLKEYPLVKHFDGYVEANFYVNGFETIKDSFKDIDPKKKKDIKKNISDLLKK